VARRILQRSRWQTVAAVLLILAVAAIFRLWHIESIPPGLHGDEATNGMDALDVLAGRGSVYFPGNYGVEGLNAFFIAAFFRLLGISTLAIRLPSVVGGILTPLAVYWLGRELFRSDIRKGKLTVVPLLAALWLATAYWAVNYSRVGERASFTILFGACTFAAFWRGVNEKSENQPVSGSKQGAWTEWIWFLLSGVFLGLSLYFYSISRFYPVLLGVFLLVQALVASRAKSESNDRAGSSLLGSLFWRIVALYGAAAAVFAPLGWYFLSHPGSFMQRAQGVAAFGNYAQPWARIGRSVIGNVAQFFLPGFGETRRFYNLPGRAVMESVTAVLAILGLLICLRCWKRPPYLMLLLWWPIMLVPAFLAVDRIPTAFRAMGVMPALYFFPAIAIGTGVDWLTAHPLPVRLRRSLIAALLIVPLAVAAVWTGRDYATWASLPGTYEAFEGEAVEAAHWLQANPQPWPVYVSADLYRHMSFLFVYSQTPTTQFATYHDPTVRWFDGRSVLPLPPMDGKATYVFIDGALPDAQWLDLYLPERQVVYLSFVTPETSGLLVLHAAYADRRQTLAGASPAEGVEVTGYDVFGEAQPGSPVQVALHWHFAGTQPGTGAGYRVDVALVDDQGTQWSMVQQPLEYRPQEWDTDSQAVSWYQLVLPAEAPKAAYHVAVRMADRATGAELSPWAEMDPSYRAENAPAEVLATFGETLRVLDARTQIESVPGGEQVLADLVLAATAPQPWSYTLFLHVLDANGQKVGQRDTATGNGLYPCDAWQPGQAIRDVYRIPIEVTGAQTPYRLALGFYDWRTGERLPAADQTGNSLPDDQLLLGVP
jgi:4-amino-4-deoxy-L-arabinose transferase-like glycosyltransferase